MNQLNTDLFCEALSPFVLALVKGDKEVCTVLVDQVLEAETSILTVYQALFQPALSRVGELWAANRISVATEHMATSIVEGLMNRLYPRIINLERCGRKAVLATVEGELHQVGIKMAADVFEMHGWDTVFPGADISTPELLGLLKEERPDLLGLSFSIFSHLDRLERILARVRATYPELPILVGGQGLDWGGEEVVGRVSETACVRTLDELETEIRIRT